MPADSSTSPGEPPSTSILPPAPIFWLSAVVIVCALFSVIAVLFGVGGNAPLQSPIGYAITLSLLCFALSSISCLLFVAKAEIKATFGVFALTVGGPAAMWVASLAMINYLYPPPAFFKTETLIELLRDAELKHGWKTFPDWLQSLDLLTLDLEPEEASQIRQAMDSAFYLGDDGKKASGVSAQVVFVYVGDKTVKLERITGQKSGSVEIYFTSHPTISGKISSVLLARDDTGITEAYPGGHRDFQPISSDQLDCLIVTLYNESMLEHGDVLYVNLPKYLKQGADGTVDLAVLASSKFEKFRVWEFRGFPFPVAADIVPLEFRQISGLNSDSALPVVSKLSPWFALIDRRISDGSQSGVVSGDMLQLLRNIADLIPQHRYQSLTDAKLFTGQYSVQIEHEKEAIVATFLKKPSQ